MGELVGTVTFAIVTVPAYFNDSPAPPLQSLPTSTTLSLRQLDEFEAHARTKWQSDIKHFPFTVLTVAVTPAPSLRSLSTRPQSARRLRGPHSH